MLTGIREAIRALHLLRGDSEEAGAEAADAVASEVHRKRKKVSCNQISCQLCLARKDVIAAPAAVAGLPRIEAL